MLFHSPIFIFLFLPFTFFLYFFLNHYQFPRVSKVLLVLASLFFYGWWNVDYLPLIIGSVLFNYFIGAQLAKTGSKPLLILGVTANLALLGYFKYTDFFITNFNLALHADFNLLHLILPLAISFFTFQQIAYLVDSYRGETQEYDFLNYAVFVTFFPQLIAGPIVHHREMMPQFSQHKTQRINLNNIALGLFLFSIGLFKKIIIADSFSIWVDSGFNSQVALGFFAAWTTSLSYSIQLYFDFSGYVDMAIGAALLFNIRLPINFNSPYKAYSIQDFWRRWHITLSRFLRDYIYIPLGGSRFSALISYRNLFVTFLVGGLWHGAGWTFLLWGALHSVAMIIHRLWQRIGFALPVLLAWFITFNFINLTWVYFRANDLASAHNIILGMLGLQGINTPISYLPTAFLAPFGTLFDSFTASIPTLVNIVLLLLILPVLSFTFLAQNTTVIFNKGMVSSRQLYAASFLALCAISRSLFATSDVFLYFNF